eukprot:gene99-133_t
MKATFLRAYDPIIGERKFLDRGVGKWGTEHNMAYCHGEVPYLPIVGKRRIGTINLKILQEEINITDQDSLFEHHHIQVDAGQSPCRIDKFLMDRLPNVSRTKVQVAIDNGVILVNGQPTKANYKVKPHDSVQVVLPHPPRNNELLPENIPLDIVYEDEALMIINKPAGLVVHPGYNNWTGTLVNALVYHFNNLPMSANNVDRPGLVHRIDKDTSGLLVIAKTEGSLMSLGLQFYHHSIVRNYYALVWGEPAGEFGTVDINLDRSLHDRRIVAPYADPTKGKRAVTHYQVIQRLRYVSLVKCTLETGRTHQIRAHMKHIGHPIFADMAYGGHQVVKGEQFSKYKAFVENCFQMMPRQALHAFSLGFKHPVTQKDMYFEAPIPTDFQAPMEWLKRQFRDHFWFSKAEVKGVWVLLILLIGFLMLFPMLGAYYHQRFTNTHALDRDLLNRTLERLERQSNEHTARLSRTTAHQMPYSIKKDKVGKVIPISAFDINTADMQQLCALPGIGKVRAEKIIKYRNKLGGFVHQGQYREVHGLDKLPLESLHQYAYIAPHFQPKKIDINADNFKTLLAHPYLSYEQVRLLVAYRKQKGPFKEVEALRKYRILDEVTWKKITPYLMIS